MGIHQLQKSIYAGKFKSFDLPSVTRQKIKIILTKFYSESSEVL